LSYHTGYVKVGAWSGPGISSTFKAPDSCITGKEYLRILKYIVRKNRRKLRLCEIESIAITSKSRTSIQWMTHEPCASIRIRRTRSPLELRTLEFVAIQRSLSYSRILNIYQWLVLILGGGYSIGVMGTILIDGSIDQVPYFLIWIISIVQAIQHIYD